MSSRLQGYLLYFREHKEGLILLFASACLTLIGLVELASASMSFIREDYFMKQVAFLCVAIVAGTLVAFVDLERIRKYTWIMAIIAVCLLVMVLIPGIGVKVNGAKRWLGLGPVRFQVSEFAKLSLVFLLANYMSNNQRKIQSFFVGFVIPCLIIGFFCGLILIEPDFGTAFLCGCVGFCMLFYSGVPLRFIIPTVMLGLLIFAIGISLDPIRLQRITSFMDVEANRQEGAYQLWQGILGFAAGGFKGAGLGNGRQQIFFLPESHTDFIFPIIGEELGLICTAVIALLYLAIFIVGIVGLRKAPNIFHFSLGTGALFFVVFQALINMGVVTGLLPTKGMSLPFISYGGSNLVFMFIWVGILLNCFRMWDAPPMINVKDL